MSHFDYRLKNFRMFSLLDLCFMFCSCDLNVSVQRIMGFFYLSYPQINEVRKYNDMDIVIAVNLVAVKLCPCGESLVCPPHKNKF